MMKMMRKEGEIMNHIRDRTKLKNPATNMQEPAKATHEDYRKQ